MEWKVYYRNYNCFVVTSILVKCICRGIYWILHGANVYIFGCVRCTMSACARLFVECLCAIHYDFVAVL